MKLSISLPIAISFLAFLVSCQTTNSVTAELRIGMVFDLAGRGDNSYNDSAYRGLVALAKAYSGWIQGSPDQVNYGSELEIKYLQPQGSGQDRETKTRALAQEGYPLIYCAGFLFTDAVQKVAKDFPQSHFVLIDGYIPDLTGQSNITCLYFRVNEAAFLVGAIAALKADGKPIGFLGGMDIPLIHRFENGFIGGAIYANPKYRERGLIFREYIGKEPAAFNDPLSAYRISSGFYKRGASIVFHAAGRSGDGLFKAAEEANQTAIGVQSDQGLIYMSAADSKTRARGRYILTSTVNRLDTAVFLSAKDFLDSNQRMEGGYRSFGLREDAVGFAENQYNQGQLANVRDRILRLRADISDGKIVVPDEKTDMDSWRALE